MVFFSNDSAGNRAEIAEGAIRILPDVAGANPADTRTYNERLLASLRLLAQGKALDDVTIYKIGTREVTTMLSSSSLSRTAGPSVPKVRPGTYRPAPFVKRTIPRSRGRSMATDPTAAGQKT